MIDLLLTHATLEITNSVVNNLKKTETENKIISKKANTNIVENTALNTGFIVGKTLKLGMQFAKGVNNGLKK